MLVDASRSNSSPGCVVTFDVSEKPLPVRFFNHSTHAFGLSAAVELARALGRLPRSVIVYAIEGEDFQAGSKLSSAVKTAVNQVAGQIRHRLRGN